MINISVLVAGVCIESDPLVASVIAETGNCYSDGPPCVDALRADATRLSAVLAAARAVVAAGSDGGAYVPDLADALAAADAAITGRP